MMNIGSGATAHGEILVIGGTPAGIAMAVRAAREGADVLVVNHNAHLGGMLTSGLGVWDTRYEGPRAPIYDEVRQAIFDYYRHTYGEDSPQYRDAVPGPTGHNGSFEPHVAEKVLTDLLRAEKRVTTKIGLLPVKAKREGPRLVSVTFRDKDGARHIEATAEVFADCTYEGDLLPLAKAPYRIGRESRDEYHEPHAGVVFMGPTTEAPTEEVRRLAQEHATLRIRRRPGFQVILPGSTGLGDHHVQAANYRTILSADPSNQIPIEKPSEYDPVLLRELELGFGIRPIPNQKVGLNRPQLLALQDDYVEGDWSTRQRVMQKHWEAMKALLWFHQHDPSVAPEIRRHWLQYGLAKDEFADNAHRPYELYVREARRLWGRYTFTQHDVMLVPGLRRAPVHVDSIAFTEWYVDSHACTDRRVPGSLREGTIILHNETFPGQLPYRCLLPQGLDNVLVPVCLSATHIAWNTVRLEPTWMHIAEAAAFAAIQALNYGHAPAHINTALLLRRLAARGVGLSFFNDLVVAPSDPASVAAHYFATKGFFPSYDAHLETPLGHDTAMIWTQAFHHMQDNSLDAEAVLLAVSDAENRNEGKVTENEFAARLSLRPDTAAARAAEPLTRGKALCMMWDRLNTP